MTASDGLPRINSDPRVVMVEDILLRRLDVQKVWLTLRWLLNLDWVA